MKIFKFIIITVVPVFIYGCVVSEAQKNYDFLKELGIQKVTTDTVFMKLIGRENLLPEVESLKKGLIFKGKDSTFPMPVLKNKIFIYGWYRHEIPSYPIFKKIGVSLEDSITFDLTNRLEFNKMMERESLGVISSAELFEITKWWLSGFFRAKEGRYFTFVTNINDIIQYEERYFYGFSPRIFDKRGMAEVNELRQKLATVKDSIPNLKIEPIESESTEAFRMRFCIWNSISWTLSHWEIEISRGGLILFAKKKVIAEFKSIIDKYY